MSESSGIARRRALARDEPNPSYVQRRAELVEAAARVFKTKGLQGASLGDIAAESGSDRASLYYYVGSKEELFHEVVRGAVEANLLAAQEIRAGDGSVPEKLRTLLQSLMASYEQNYPILYVYIQENLSHVPDQHAGWANDMRLVNKAYEQVVVDLVADGMRDGSIRDVGEPWVVAFGLMGMIGWTSRWFNPETTRATAKEIAGTFADTLLLGLQTDRPHLRRAT